jgi:acyl-CoA thioesterase YciA
MPKSQVPQELEGKVPTLSVVSRPKDTNSHGNIFGGWLMSHMDLAGAMGAIEFCGQDIVTRHAETLFEKPISVGDKVNFYTEIKKVGTTSVVVGIDVWAMRRGRPIYDKVASGNYTFVAIDENKQAVPISEADYGAE